MRSGSVAGEDEWICLLGDRFADTAAKYWFSVHRSTPCRHLPVAVPGAGQIQCCAYLFQLRRKVSVIVTSARRKHVACHVAAPSPDYILQYRRDRLLVQRVRKLLISSVTDINDAETAAQQLHVSTRSMYRQLHEEGTSFQSLKDEVRRDRAIRLLCSTDKLVKQIALSVGFSSEKSFARAFKQWTGDTPRDYRRQRRPE